jgi:RHS repeat-associated protein
MSVRQFLVSRASKRGIVIVAVVLALGMGGGAIAIANQLGPARPAAPARLPSVPGHDAVARPAPQDLTPAVHGRPAVAWPTAGAATLNLPAAATDLARPAGLTWTGALPVGIAAAGRAPALSAAGSAPAVAQVRVQVLDRTAALTSGRDFVVRVSRTDGVAAAGPVLVGIDYARFRDAYGGDWARRLQVVELPDCALSTPNSPQCQGKVLPTRNDTSAHVVTAQTSAVSGGTVLALAAGASSDGGDFTATDLKAAGTWSAGGEAGDFSWSYPMRTPPSLGGPSPKVAVGYSAQSVDGQTAAANAQPSWVGEGFGYDAGSIQRGYRACADDGQAGSGDLCWAGDNATMSLNGHSTILVLDAATGLWRPRGEEGSTVERLTNTGLGNGDNDGEFWKVTTTDGTQYFFGLNRIPGWTAGARETNSVYYEPVFGNQAGEPCHQTTFAASSCQQGYRWNLDYVVDPHGNSMSLYYNRETNKYARNHVDTDAVTYVRGGQVAEIDYGTRQDAGVDSVFANAAPARVLFGTTDRCIVAGATCTPTTANASNWPDVPVDQICSATTCTGKYAPAFFTTKKLSTVTTQVANGTGSWRRVEQWRLTHEFKDPGDGNQKILWLKQLDHCGVSDSTCVPPTVFNPVQLSNRVDLAGTTNSIIRYRIASITSESGGVIAVTYSTPECVTGSNMPTSPDTNTKRCFPVYWTPAGSTTPKLEYFHKYVVTAVAEGDLVGGSPDEATYYTYLGAPAWHYDNNPLALATRQTWGQWRGYGQVRVTTGVASETQSKTETTYFRGMDQEKTATGTRSVTVADSDGGTWVDSDWFAGLTRETITYLGPTTTVVSKTKTDPYQFGPTASQTLNGVAFVAYVTATAVSTTKTALDGGRGWRTTRVTTGYLADRTGRSSQVDDEGDVATTADDRCTRYTYAANAAGTMLVYPTREETVGVRCAATPNRAVDTLSDVRTWYDGAASYGTTVTLGEPTRTEQLADYSGGNPTYAQLSRTRYDQNGRVLDSYDALDHKTSTAYTPTSGPVTRVGSTNPKGWVSTTDADPGWGLPVTMTDPNGRHTDLAYDGLGRLTAVWRPGRDKATQTADVTFAYTVRNGGGPSTVTTARLNTAGTGYLTSYSLYDGMLRLRQVQGPATGGGRLIAETLYDSRGLAIKSRPEYFNANGPGTTLFLPNDVAVPNQTVSVFDGAARPVTQTLQIGAVNKWHTSTAYGGDHTDVSVPAGGTATSTWTDARGQTTAVWQYHGNVASGVHDTITRGYDRAGNLASAVDAAGNTWSYGYDQRRRKVSETDPDKGSSTITYDDADQVSQTVDSRGSKVVFSYDELGRRTGEFLTSTSGTKLAEWTYDTLVKGGLTASTRYAGGNAYTTTVTGYTVRDQVTGTKVSIPAAAGPLAGDYVTSLTYNANGSLATQTAPAKVNAVDFGGIPDETLSYGYTDIGSPRTMSGAASYVTDTMYLQTGQISSVNATVGNGKNILQYWTYEPGTARLADHQVLGDFATVVAADVHYGYDDAGNVLSVANKTAQYGAGADDNQCFRYDYLRRLVDAWTPATAPCATAPSTGGLGGPAPYWSSYGYDVVGDRTTETTHAAAGNTTYTYAYPATGQPQSHTARTVTATGLSTATRTYGYDSSGNTTTRSATGKPTQTLTWDADGHLATLVDGTSTSSYVYDTDGNRLVSYEPTATTLYLGGTECRAAGGTVSCTRTYSFGAAGDVAVRSPSGLSWLADDHQGTGEYAFRASDLSMTRRFATSFGVSRGPAATWPSAHGFVDGIADPTGLTHVGAREYDPALGRFASVDPVFADDDPQGWQGYAYANNTPVTASDPSGLSPSGPCDTHHSAANCEPDTSTWNGPCDSHHSAANCDYQDHSTWNGPCDGHHSAANCDYKDNHKPTDVMSSTTFKHGTTLSRLYNGLYLINGFPLPTGVKDPFTLAERVDERMGDAKEDPRNLIATTGMIGLSCDPTICTLEFKKQVESLHTTILAERMSATDPMHMVAFCFNAGVVDGVAAGGSVCVGFDDNTWGVFATRSFGGGSLTPIPGGMSLGIQMSDGYLEDQVGDFNFGQGTLGPLDVGGAWGSGASGQPVHTGSLGLGTPGISGSGGTSHTYVWRCCEWKVYG